MGKDASESIAIIGMAARVPGARNIHHLWGNLVEGRESISVFDREDQQAKGLPATVVDDPAFVPAAPVLEDMESFDADYFGMTPREAEITDPQHRLFLELSHTALEDGGYDPSRSVDSIGVYGGCGPDTYRWRNVERSSAVLDATNWLAVTVGNYPDYFATRVSYRLNLRGPSYGLQTACSTSLVALHVACEALLRGECDMALAGGVCIELPHGVGYVYDGGVTSRDGHCRPFDAAASGTVWSSGGGIVLLKRLSRALADGDNVRAIVLGSAINNDGANKSGMTAPSAEGQGDAARRALDKAGIDPRSVSYVEAHGTGTQLGDPVELAGLSSAYGANGETEWCSLGSIKSNVGHLSQAAGVVGVIKTVLSLEHQQIPPTINFVEPNPALRLAESPFRIANALRAWEASDTPRRAGVSSFGIGGTNAHVVLQEAPRRQHRTPDTSTAQLLRVSAKTPEALDQLVGDLDAFRAAATDLDLADVAYTLRVGRSVHRHRAVAVVGADADQQAAWRRGIALKQPPSAVFLFSGQGAQYPGMAALYDHEREFAAAVDECLDSLDGDLRDTLRTLLLTTAEPNTDSPIDQTRYTQPALFVVEYAVARLWQSWGVEPSAMIGHSIGEYVAATLAGVFTFADALRLVVARGELMQSTQPGAMLAVTVEDGGLEGLELPDELSLACVNAPGAVIVSGPADAVETYAGSLRRHGVDCKPLRTSHAFHSATMDPILDAFRAEVASVALRAPTRRYLSNLTGTWQTAERAQDPGYWVDHLRGTVRFADNVSTLLGEDGAVAFIECGPGKQLTNLVLAQAPEVTAVASLPGPTTDADPAQTILLAAGTLWTAGLAMTPAPDALGATGNRVPLPTYPYQRRTHWATPDPTPRANSADETPAATQPAVQPVDRWFHTETWRQDRLPGESHRPARSVLFTADEHGRRVAAQLRERGVPVIEVWPGDRFRRDGDDRYEINPEAPDDYADLVRGIGPAGLTHIVHAWSVAAPTAGDDPDTVMAVQQQGFYSLLHLVQALTAAGADGPVQLDVVTRGAQEVLGGELTNPEQATLSGIAKVLPLEGQLFSVRHVDVDSAADGTDGALVIELLRRPGSRTETVALRNGRRWLPEYMPLSLTERDAGTDDSSVDGSVDGLVERGVYLITGGLGAIGLTVAEDLATRAKARLVLTGRVGLPERRTWARYLSARGNSDRTGRAIEAIQRMEDAGAEVLVLAADVTEPEDLTYLRDTIVEEYGRLDGIVHAAGVPTGTMLELQDRKASEQVLAPKLRGTPALYRALADLEPSFLLLCSSITAAFGRLGHADYCAANSYLDAFARAHHSGGTRVVSVGWDAWLSIGMAVDQSEPDHVRSARQSARRAHLPGVLLEDEQDVGIAPDDGVAAMHALLGAGISGHVLTSVLPVAAARAGWQVDVASLSEAPDTPEFTPQPADQPPGSLEETLAHIWADTLGHPVVGLDQDFVELGGDSLTAIRLLSRIRETTGVALSRRSLFEASTVQQLAATIDEMRTRGAADTEPAPTENRPAIARLSRS